MAVSRRTVTVLFADIADWTALGERLDPESLRQVMTRYFDAMGAVLESHGGTLEKFWTTLKNIPDTSLTTLAVSVSVLGVILGLKAIDKRIPGALIAVIGAIWASWALDLSSHGVAVLGHVPGGLPSIGLPQPGWDDWLTLVPTAASIFLVILAQSAATSRAYAAKYNEPFDENLDLVGLSLANVSAGLTGTFVVNGSPTKTEMVDEAKSHTQVAQLTTAVVVAIVLLTLAVRRLSIEYTLTTQRFLHQRGLLRRVANRILLIDIDDVLRRQAEGAMLLDTREPAPSVETPRPSRPSARTTSRRLRRQSRRPASECRAEWPPSSLPRMCQRGANCLPLRRSRTKSNSAGRARLHDESAPWFTKSSNDLEMTRFLHWVICRACVPAWNRGCRRSASNPSVREPAPIAR
jgi:hypothetical protein